MLIKLNQAPELLEPGVDLLPAELTQALQAKLFHSEAAHHRAIDHRAVKVVRLPSIGRDAAGGEVSHETARQSCLRLRSGRRLPPAAARERRKPLFPRNIVAPLSPRLITTVEGPMARIARAAFNRLYSPLNWRASESLIMTACNPRRVFSSSARFPSIQKFMVSPRDEGGSLHLSLHQ